MRVRWHMWSLAPEWRAFARGVTGRGHKRCKALNIIPIFGRIRKLSCSLAVNTRFMPFHSRRLWRHWDPSISPTVSGTVRFLSTETARAKREVKGLWIPYQTVLHSTQLQNATGSLPVFFLCNIGWVNLYLNHTLYLYCQVGFTHRPTHKPNCHGLYPACSLLNDTSHGLEVVSRILQRFQIRRTASRPVVCDPKGEGSWRHVVKQERYVGKK